VTMKKSFIKLTSGLNPLIVARSDSPILHPMMNGNNNNVNIFPILPNSGVGGYGTLGRRPTGQSYVGGSMTLGRPRSERFCDAEIETHFHNPKRVQFPPEEFGDQQRYGGSVW